MGLLFNRLWSDKLFSESSTYLVWQRLTFQLHDGAFILSNYFTLDTLCRLSLSSSRANRWKPGKERPTILHAGEFPCVLLQVTIRWVRPPRLMVYSVNPTSLDPGL